MKATETIKDKLRKIAKLAELGVAGEKENAKRLLERLMAKYGLTIADLSDEVATKICKFTYRSKHERQILIQCYAKASGVTGVRCREIKRALYFELTWPQRLELVSLYSHFRKLFKKETEIFMQAFVAKHDLYGHSEGEQAECPLSHDEIMQIAHMAAGMKESEYTSTRRQLKSAEKITC